MTIAAFALKLTHPVVDIIAVSSDIESLKKELDKVNRSFLTEGSSVISHPTNLDENIAIRLNTIMVEQGYNFEGRLKFRAKIVKLSYSEIGNPLDDLFDNYNFHVCVETIAGKRLRLDGATECKAGLGIMKHLARRNIIDFLNQSSSPIGAFVKSMDILNEDTHFGRLKNLFVCERGNDNIFKATTHKNYYEVFLFKINRPDHSVVVYHTFDPRIENIVREHYSDGFTYDINTNGFENHLELHVLLTDNVNDMIKQKPDELKNIRVCVRHII